MEQMPKESKEMEDLRTKVIKLAHQNPDLRPHLLPLLRTAKLFEDAIKGRKFRNPETGNQVEFGSLPAEEQKRIRSQWVKKNPRGSGGSGDDPKQMMQDDSDKYFAEHVSGGLTKKSLSDALKDTEWAPRGKGSYDKQRQFVSLLLDHKDHKKLPMHVVFSGSHYTKGDKTGYVSVEGRHGHHDDTFKLSGNPEQDAKAMHKTLKELIDDYKTFDKLYDNPK